MIIRLIENCRWDSYEEVQAVSAFVRSFGTNSYGKFNDYFFPRGQYKEYSEYWKKIVDCLNTYASSNPEAMLISGHFTRDYIETSYKEENGINFLEDAITGMKGAVENCFVKSTCSRLYGEICRNLLQQMTIYNDKEVIEELSYEFKHYFELAVKNGKESRKNNNSFSLILLLDIWLNYVIFIDNYNCADDLLPDTLEYIDLLFYDESNLIDDSEDYVNVISNINTIYDKINERDTADLRTIFSKSNNDSYVYCLAKQILVRLFLKFKENYPKLFDKKNNDHVLSSRIFFLNENSANDFDHYQRIVSNQPVRQVFQEIKQALRTASEEIICILEGGFSSQNEMTYRCLLMYLKAKWMSYTGNLLLENEQYPALTNAQWREMSKICKTAIANAGDRDNDAMPRSVNFIQNIYAFVFEKKRWEQHRYFSESPVRLICLCHPGQKNGKSIPRLFRVSVKENNFRPNKLMAEIDYEIVDGNKMGTGIVGQKHIYVPENIRNYRDIKRNNMNIDQNFVIWFNIGGPQLQDCDPEKEA